MPNTSQCTPQYWPTSSNKLSSRHGAVTQKNRDVSVFASSSRRSQSVEQIVAVVACMQWHTSQAGACEKKLASSSSFFFSPFKGDIPSLGETGILFVHRRRWHICTAAAAAVVSVCGEISQIAKRVPPPPSHTQSEGGGRNISRVAVGTSPCVQGRRWIFCAQSVPRVPLRKPRLKWVVLTGKIGSAEIFNGVSWP